MIQSEQKRVEGPLQYVTESGITLRAIGEVTVPKEKVIRMYRAPSAKRAIRAVCRSGIGAVAGATSTAGQRFRNEGLDVPSGTWIVGGASWGYQTLYLDSGKA